MKMKRLNLFFMIALTLTVLAGCEKVQNTVIDNAMMDSEAIPVRLIWLMDYSEKAQSDYIEWIAAVAETLKAPEELIQMRCYDNEDIGTSPHQLVEFDFKSFEDAATYLSYPEIAAIFNEVDTLTFIQDVDYTYAKEEESDWQIKHILLIDYVLFHSHPERKQIYLEYAKEASAVLIPPTQLKAVASYDNYYGETPHRLVEFQFATQEDANAYHALEEVMQVAEAEPEKQAGKWTQVMHKFKLRSDCK